MKLMKKKIKQIEELTGLFFDEDNSVLISSEDKKKYPNKNHKFKYIFWDEAILDHEGYPTGEVLNELQITNETIIYRNLENYYDVDGLPNDVNVGFPLKWLIPLAEIFKGGE